MFTARFPWIPVVTTVVVCVTLAAVVYYYFGQEPRPAEYIRSYTSEARRLTAIRYGPEGNYLAAGSASGLVLVWRSDSGEPATQIQVSAEPISTIAISDDGFFMAADAANGLFGWQSGEEQRLKSFGTLSAPAVCIAFRPSQEREIVLGLSDGTIKFLTKSGIQELQTEHQGSVKSFEFHPQGRVLVIGGEDGKLNWYDLDTRQSQSIVEAHEGELSEVVFSRDGRKLASADWNGSIKVWDAKNQSLLAEMSQSEAVCGMGWTGDDLVTGGWDGFIRSWSVADQALLAQVATHHPILDLSLRPDGSRVAIVGNSAQVEFWRVPLPRSARQ